MERRTLKISDQTRLASEFPAGGALIAGGQIFQRQPWSNPRQLQCDSQTWSPACQPCSPGRRRDWRMGCFPTMLQGRADGLRG
jgi:hypothetical protein